jgi:hypothetical protein
MQIVKIVSFFTLIECNLAFFNNHKEPEIEISDDDLKSSVLNNVQEGWISQKLDHFDDEEKRVWDMRFLQNDGFFTEGESA